MEKSLEEARALADAARLRRVVECLRYRAEAAIVAELQANTRHSFLERQSTLDPPPER
ncbi:MAG TPA: hypothetical protein VGL92_05000 [Acidimicrobiia bacterium]|jgi:hypothetical protein